MLLHPAFVHFPIAFLIAGSLSALAYMHWRPLRALRTLFWYGLAAGWLTLLMAVISGLIDQGRLPPDAAYRTLLNLHTTSGLVLVVLYADVLYRGWLHSSGAGKKSRSRSEEIQNNFLLVPGRRWLLTLELVVGIGLVIASGYLGGQLVYSWGVNVAVP